MALKLRPPGTIDDYDHVCPLPWPVDPEVPEGHLCECGRRWVYQPARWDPLVTLEELRLRQEAGEFVRGIIPRFRSAPQPLDGVIVPIPPALRATHDPALREVDDPAS
jgi:hypothetical protein